jgi:hypothetical protein
MTKIIAFPARLPIRWGVTCLLFLRKLRGLHILSAIAEPETAVLSLPKDDWALFQETLSLDARSPVFDAGLRADIRRALAHVREW